MKWPCNRLNCWLGNLTLGIKLAEHLYTLLWQPPVLYHFRSGRGELFIGMEKPGRRIGAHVVRDEDGMADVRPKSVLVGSQGTTCSICSWLCVTQAAVNSALLSAIYPLGQEIPLSEEENKRDKTGKKNLCFISFLDEDWNVLKGCESFPCGVQGRLGLWSLTRVAACSWKLWGSCLEEMTFPRQQWGLRSLSEWITCVHISVGTPAAGENSWFLSAFFWVWQKISPSSLSPWALLSFLPISQAALSWTAPSSI